MMPHPVAAKGFSSDADRYEFGRPDYPSVAVDHILEEIGVTPSTVIADVGAGTGKFTRMLNTSGAQIVAVEPVVEMARLIEQFSPRAFVVRGIAEQLPFEDDSIDAITVAQAFHWFDEKQVWSEFARVLAPGGTVALVWNARLPDVEWVQAIWHLMDTIERDAPWRNHAQPPRYEAHPAFTEAALETFPHVVPMTLQRVIARVLSVSHVAVMNESEQAAVIRDVSEIVASTDSPLEIPYRTDVHIRHSS